MELSLAGPGSLNVSLGTFVTTPPVQRQHQGHSREFRRVRDLNSSRFGQRRDGMEALSELLTKTLAGANPDGASCL